MLVTLILWGTFIFLELKIHTQFPCQPFHINNSVEECVYVFYFKYFSFASEEEEADKHKLKCKCIVCM
jgi:hypothetical protein